MNSGLIKSKGNLTKTVRIIVFAGVSVGGAESIRLNEENAKAATKIPSIIIKIFNETHNPKSNIPRINGTIEKMHPKAKELQIFPNNIVFIEIGHAINLSRVLILVSHGNTTGPIEVAVKNRVIAISPDIRKTGMILLPIVNAKNNTIGNKIP